MTTIAIKYRVNTKGSPRATFVGISAVCLCVCACVREPISVGSYMCTRPTLPGPVKNRSFQYGKVALARGTQKHQLQFVLKVAALCTDTRA